VISSRRHPVPRARAAASAFPVALLANLVIACGPLEIEDSRRTLLTSWGEGVLLPLYGDFEARAGVLAERNGELCAAPDETTLGVAREAWWSARAPLKQAEVFAFGPFKEFPWRLGPTIDFWPARPATVDEILAGSEPLDAEAAAALGAAARGLPAIEYLLYPPGLDVLSELGPGTRRCEYLAAISADLVARAGDLRHAWDRGGEDYLGELIDAGRGSKTFMTLEMAVGEVVNRMGYLLENMRNDKLRKPLGGSIDGPPAPGAAESRFSQRSLEDLRDNVRGLELVYFGPHAGAPGLGSYLRSRGKEFDPFMTARFDAAMAALDAVPEPFTAALLEDPRAVVKLIDALDELGRAIQIDILNALATNVGFNDNDGD
jgi:predicted lipoprotein